MKRTQLRRKTRLARGTSQLKRTPFVSHKKPSRTTKDGRTILTGADYQALTDDAYKRDGGMCQVCPELGRPSRWIPRRAATLDHKKPRKAGGSARDDVHRERGNHCSPT